MRRRYVPDTCVSTLRLNIYICEIWNVHENFEKFITKSIYAQKIQDSGVIRTVMWRLMIYQKEKNIDKNKNEWSFWKYAWICEKWGMSKKMLFFAIHIRNSYRMDGKLNYIHSI